MPKWYTPYASRIVLVSKQHAYKWEINWQQESRAASFLLTTPWVVVVGLNSPRIASEVLRAPTGSCSLATALDLGHLMCNFISQWNLKRQCINKFLRSLDTYVTATTPTLIVKAEVVAVEPLPMLPLRTLHWSLAGTYMCWPAGTDRDWGTCH